MSQKEQEVWRACDDLLASGRKPREITGEAIGARLRELNCKPGSLTYRYKYRDTWMTARGLSREDDDYAAKPSDVIERSAVIFRKAIEEEIRREYLTSQQLMQEQIGELKARLASQEEELASLKLAYQAVIQKNAQQEGALQEKQLQLQFAKQEVTIERAERQMLSNLMVEAKRDYQQQLDELAKQYESAWLECKDQIQEREQYYNHMISHLQALNEQQRQDFLQFLSKES